MTIVTGPGFSCSSNHAGLREGFASVPGRNVATCSMICAVFIVCPFSVCVSVYAAVVGLLRRFVRVVAVNPEKFVADMGAKQTPQLRCRIWPTLRHGLLLCLGVRSQEALNQGRFGWYQCDAYRFAHDVCPFVCVLRLTCETGYYPVPHGSVKCLLAPSRNCPCRYRAQ